MAVSSTIPAPSAVDSRPIAEVMPFEVCVPLYRTITPETHASLMALMQHCPWMVYTHRIGARLMDALEEFAQNATQEYMLMVDGDMVFSVGDVIQLFNALRRRPEMGAIGGLYRKWSRPYTHLVHWRETDGTWINDEAQKHRVERYMKTGEVVGVDLFGGGFILCRTEAFEKLEAPYFRSGKDEGGEYGQDCYFAKSLNEAGYKPSVHFGVQLGHVGPRTVWPCS